MTTPIEEFIGLQKQVSELCTQVESLATILASIADMLTTQKQINMAQLELNKNIHARINGLGDICRPTE